MEPIVAPVDQVEELPSVVVDSLQSSEAFNAQQEGKEVDRSRLGTERRVVFFGISPLIRMAWIVWKGKAAGN
ncbi:hypothetical protein SUGI_1074430 [Cryptomeria japonica]|nr:hypothetical protein SUGI_1074430 [Cryptomeria japonica]